MISGIVLAAGTSSRLGRPKQLLLLGGVPVVRRVVDTALSSRLDEVLVVLGHEAERILEVLPASTGLRAVLNPGFASGQGSSLASGLRAAAPGSAAAVVLLGDQPTVRAEAIAAVTAAWRAGAGPAVQASYGGRPAHPTLFDRLIWWQLEQVTGDQGARSLLRANADWLSTVEVGGDPPDDIDTEEDYLRIRAAFEV